MIDFAKWMVAEHPILSFFAMYFPCWAVHGLGQIASTRIKHKHKGSADAQV